MRLIRLLLLFGIAVGIYQWYDKRVSDKALAAAQSAYGFVELPPMNAGAKAPVLVVAAENCPEDAAQRADRLADDLSRQGVPVARTHNVSFTIPNGDPDVVARINAVMNGPLPIVFVRGRAKSNASLDEVLAEYRAGR
jgi:hypothetical protein